MSKRDIKAKRWGRKSAKRQMAVEPVIVDGFPRGPQLRFLTQYRKFGDGREQLRDGSRWLSGDVGRLVQCRRG